MTEQIQNEVREAVLVLTFNRPDKKNAVTHEMYSELAAQLRNAAENDAIKAVVFTGNGDAFTAGNDITDFIAMAQNVNEEDIYQTPVFQFLYALAEFDKPLLAAVNGLAVGIGLTLLLHCDIAYASEEAVFSAPFVDLGLVAEAASSLLLPLRVGQCKANEILLLGKTLDAAEAAKIGLINDTLPTRSLLEQTLKAANKLAQKPTTALQETRRLLRPDPGLVKERMNLEGKIFAERMKSSEAQQAFAAFMSQ